MPIGEPLGAWRRAQRFAVESPTGRRKERATFEVDVIVIEPAADGVPDARAYARRRAKRLQGARERLLARSSTS